MDYRKYARSFGDDSEETDSEKTGEEGPAYVFDGFTIELNEKIALTPVTTSKN